MAPGPARLVVTAFLLAAGQAGAQEGLGLSFGNAAPEGEVAARGAPAGAGRLLVIDRERVLAGSERGRALLAGLDADGRALSEENREIEARLRAEERELTARRPEMEPDAFRAEADAFDERVQDIREARDAKGRELVARREALETRFWDEAVPVLAEILRERGAVVVLERDGVFLSSDAADITAQAIARIDAAAASGAAPGGDADPPAVSPGSASADGAPEPPAEEAEPGAILPGAASGEPEDADARRARD